RSCTTSASEAKRYCLRSLSYWSRKTLESNKSVVGYMPIKQSRDSGCRARTGQRAVCDTGYSCDVTAFTPQGYHRRVSSHPTQYALTRCIMADEHYRCSVTCISYAVITNTTKAIRTGSHRVDTQLSGFLLPRVLHCYTP